MLDFDVSQLSIADISASRAVIASSHDHPAHLGGWTEERIELMKKLWLDGLSASQVAGVLGDGVTRNAVIGKVHRLKLTGRTRPASSRPRTAQPRRLPSPQGDGHFARSTKRRPTTFLSEAEKAAEVASAASDGEVYVAPVAEELFIPVEQRLVLGQLSEDTCKWPIGDPLTADFYFCGQHAEDGKPYCEFHSRRAYHPLKRKKRY